MLKGKEGGRKPWATPRLVVLGRGTPEESVLAACKGAQQDGSYPRNCKPHSNPACATKAPS